MRNGIYVIQSASGKGFVLTVDETLGKPVLCTEYKEDDIKDTQKVQYVDSCPFAPLTFPLDSGYSETRYLRMGMGKKT